MSEPAFLGPVRQSYDTVAAAYLERVVPPEGMDPHSRAMIGAFAELTRAADIGPIADLGCGPGRVTAYLDRLGLPVFGVDLSPEMIALARKAYPDLRFLEGSMTDLDIEDGSLGGILAWYSTHHTPPEWLPRVYAEFRRVLAPGGYLLLGSHVGNGDEHLQPTQAYGGLPVSYESHLIPVERMVELLAAAGLVVRARLVQEPEGASKRRHVCLLAVHANR